VQVLIRGWQGANRPFDRIYRKVYRRIGRYQYLSRRAFNVLPTPRMNATRVTRMNVAHLLSNLGHDAPLATSVMAEALKDESAGVRQIAIAFFTYTEGEDAFLNQLPNKKKRKLLPDFIRAIGYTRHSGLRNNAAIALRYYPEERETVVPVLIRALKDPAPAVRLLAAEGLHAMASDSIDMNGVVSVVIGVLKESDDQVAYRAAGLLGNMGNTPSLAVPALLESVKGTNSLVASGAAFALGSFAANAKIIAPVLLKAYQDTNSIVRRWASGPTLKKIAPAIAADAGIE